MTGKYEWENRMNEINVKAQTTSYVLFSTERVAVNRLKEMVDILNFLYI